MGCWSKVMMSPETDHPTHIRWQSIVRGKVQAIDAASDWETDAFLSFNFTHARQFSWCQTSCWDLDICRGRHSLSSSPAERLAAELLRMTLRPFSDIYIIPLSPFTSSSEKSLKFELIYLTELCFSNFQLKVDPFCRESWLSRKWLQLKRSKTLIILTIG